jgi:hypothetical protein
MVYDAIVGDGPAEVLDSGELGEVYMDLRGTGDVLLFSQGERRTGPLDQRTILVSCDDAFAYYQTGIIDPDTDAVLDTVTWDQALYR